MCEKQKKLAKFKKLLNDNFACYCNTGKHLFSEEKQINLNYSVCILELQIEGYDISSQLLEGVLIDEN